jgi:ribonuclease HI
MYIIFTDGASKGNPGPGGWAAFIADEKKVHEIGGAKKPTTNNEMELFAAMRALEETKEKSDIIIYIDSGYVVNGITKWISSWQKRGWKTTTKEDVLYRDMWERLSELVSKRKVKWNRISGHSGLVGNERVDEIASLYASGKKPKLFSGDKKAYETDIWNLSYKKEKKESKTRSRGVAYSYISVVGGVVKTHKTWKECEARVKGVSGARFKKSLNASDEQDIIRLFSN